MKKFYLLLSVALLATTASAVEKEMTTRSSDLASSPQSLMVNSQFKLTDAVAYMADKNSQSKLAKKAPDQSFSYTYFRAADNVMALGYSTQGYGYSAPFGFKPVQGDYIFNNYSTNVKSNLWNYSWYVGGEEAPYESSDTDLVIESQIAEMLAPTLTTTYNSGAVDTYSIPAAEYLAGASAGFWGFNQDNAGGEWGLTFYQNSFYKYNNQSSGFYTSKTSYSPYEEGYNANGVYIDNSNGRGRDWQSLMEKRFEGQSVTNLALQNFTYINPKPISPYFMTKGWINANISLNGETQLVSYIYPIDDEGVISEDPIAIGYAAVSNSTVMPTFDYFPLNEDGDEVDGVVLIDSSVAITVEGFLGNEAVVEISPVSGLYPISYDAYASGNYDICKEPTLYVRFSMDVDGEYTEVLTYDNGFYTLDTKGVDQDTLSLLAYGMYICDATYSYVMTANGTNSFNVPESGADVDVDFDSYYYMTANALDNGLIEIVTPEWITYEFNAPDQETGISSIKFHVAASQEGRTGVVNINSFGAVCDLTFVQGDGGTSVEVVKAENGVDYFDLTGRRVANPEKGIYVKVSGNKSEKVVL